MRNVLILLGLFQIQIALGQATVDVDSTIYDVVEEAPRFPACEQLDTTAEYKSRCAQQQLLVFVNRATIQSFLLLFVGQTCTRVFETLYMTK